MTNDELREAILRLDLTQKDLANLLGVTPRSVNMWVSGDRSVPGPVNSYLRLYEAVPALYKDAEMASVRKEQPVLREGIYGIKFSSDSDWGAGMLILENGTVYGVDIMGAKFDGEYEFNRETNLIDSKIKVTMPPNVQTVTGLPPQPFEWSFDVELSFPRETDKSQLQVSTPIGPINVLVEYMRSLPDLK